MLLKLVLFALLLPAQGTTPGRQHRARTGQPAATIKGTVFDTNGAAVPGVRVVLDDGRERSSATTDADGDYQLKVPGGSYRITTEAEGFFPARRAVFRAEPGATTTLNLRLVAHAVSEGDPPTSPPGYDSYSSTPLAPNASDQVVVRFSQKRETAAGPEYSGRVELTHGALTITADRLDVDLKRSRLEACGNLLVEEGERQRRAGCAVVYFQKGRAAITLLDDSKAALKK
jgi:Carboxypeptidase regulatory-like domain